MRGRIVVPDDAVHPNQGVKRPHAEVLADEEAVEGALRLSWCHMTEEVDWGAVVQRISQLR